MSELIQYKGYPILLFQPHQKEDDWEVKTVPPLTIEHLYIGADDITGMGHLVIVNASSRKDLTNEYLQLPKDWKWVIEYLEVGEYFDDYERNGMRFIVFDVFRDGQVFIIGGKIK